MKKIIFKNDIKLDPIGLGTYNLKGKLCEKIVSEALTFGYRHIDTAKIYNNEKNIGNAIKSSSLKRNELFITSKVSIHSKNKNIEEELKISLRDLKTSYLDLLLIHWPVFETNLNDLLKALFKVKNKQLIKRVGVSNFNSKLLLESYKLGFDIFCNQIEYHPFIKQNKLIKTMKKLKILPVAYRPLLRGKIGNNKIIKKIAKKYGKSPYQITLRWIIEKKIAVIPMSTKTNHLKENLNIFNFKLDLEDIKKINNLNSLSIRDIKNITQYKWDE